MWKRMICVYDLWGKQWKHLFFEIMFDILFFLCLQLFEIQPTDPVWMQLFFYLRIRLIPLFIKRTRLLALYGTLLLLFLCEL